MTREEFISRWTAAKHQARRIPGGIIFTIIAVLIPTIILLIVFLCILPFTDYPPDARVPVLWTLGVLVLLFGGLMCAYKVRMSKVRKLAMKCPSCDNFLLGQPGRIAVEAGRCGHCGAQVYDQ